MKLKTLVGSMAILGLVSTSAFAAPAGGNKHSYENGLSDQQKFWYSVMNRNQDNNGTMEMKTLRPGQIKASGEVSTKAQYQDKGGAHRDGTVGFYSDNPTSSIALATADLYFDGRINQHITAHIAVAYDVNNTADYLVAQKGVGHYNADELIYKDGTFGYTKEFYFPEASIELNYGKMFVNVGRQYLNFGSAAHDSITQPVTEALSLSDQDAVTVGGQALGSFYIDGSVYKGAPYANSAAEFSRTTNEVHGFSLDLGFAQKDDGYSFNFYGDYLSDMADVGDVYSSLNNVSGTYEAALPNVTARAIPAIALHGEFAIGDYNRFMLMANYVTALKRFDSEVLSTTYGAFTNPDAIYKGAKPAAWMLEGDYQFIPDQNLTIGFEGTVDAQNIREQGSDFNLPENRFLAAYTIGLAKHVKLEGQYTFDKDYGVNDGGSGENNNTLTARLRVGF